MSQLNISMKKDSIRKNKKLAINIGLSKDGLASRFGADHHDLGSTSIREEKDIRSESSERPRRDAFQRVCSKAKELDKASDVRDGLMREVNVGAGLSGALKLVREQGTFKEESKVVGVKDKHEVDRFKDGFKDVQIRRVDEWGRELTQKEAFKALCHEFHGKKPGKRKQEKRKKKHEHDDKSKHMESSDRVVERMRQVHAKLKTPYFVL
ncbi:SART-1 family protein DOT2 [Cardamine amara subsp. amara]|uniref:SART-1 family protein DOT2 n=1 Tax=Cardamine amara subsp. amara TaxID=228776 RepID=A0ABD1A6H9_CARAN